MATCSVLIPAYNVQRYVASAIESALSQTHPHFEVIVVNDGSTDGTGEHIAPYVDRITYIEQENRGLAGARNAALQRASGDYVALLDADDLWLPDRLSKMIAFLEANKEVGFATSDAYLIYGEEKTKDRFYEKLPAGKGFRHTDQEFWICQYDFINVMVVARSELFKRHGAFDESLRACEDWDLWIRFIQGGERIDLVDEPLGYYRKRPQSLSIDKLALSFHELQVLEKAAQRKKVKGLEARLAFARARWSMAEGRKEEAASFFAQAARDQELDLPTRMKASFAARFPSLAWRLYELLLDRRKQGPES